MSITRRVKSYHINMTFKDIIQRILRVPDIKVINHDTPILRALIAENAELRRRLGMPRACTIRLSDGTPSRVTYDLPARLWDRYSN